MSTMDSRVRVCLQYFRQPRNFTTGNQSESSVSGSSVDEGFDPLTTTQYRVHVQGYVRAYPVLFRINVRAGDARWPIRRRFKQVVRLHESLVAAGIRGLPRLPPRVTLRSAICGHWDRQFLHGRIADLQRYFDGLFHVVRNVDSHEFLHQFLCRVDLERWDYDALSRLGEMIGPANTAGGGAPPVDDAAIERLPKSLRCAEGRTGPDAVCVICQCAIDGPDADQDVRVLPCGHEYHFSCIKLWLRQRNTCCVCQSAAVLSAPRFLPVEGSAAER